jgi:hypothetical protein
MPGLVMLWGLVAEVLAGMLLWLSEGAGEEAWAGTPGIFGAIILHTLSSCFFAQGFWRLLPPRYKLPRWRSLGFLFSVIWILPVLGVLGVLWGLAAALNRPRNRSLKDVQLIALPELPFSPPFIFPTPPYSEGALRQIVHFADRPLKRLKAVMATRSIAPRAAAPIWSKATRDPVDDVRLLAYAMKDDKEKSLTDRILVLTEALSGCTPQIQTSYHKAIAASCWELVYHKLVQGALRQHWLETARRHMEVALEVPAVPGVTEIHDPDAWLLYGRILLESQDLDEAKTAFGNAQAGGIDEEKIFPWLAEIAFEQGRYDQVKSYLSILSHPCEKGKELALVKAWWNR